MGPTSAADYTKAAVRALRDALWNNSLNVAARCRCRPIPWSSKSHRRAETGVVDKAQVLAVLPHGTGTVTVGEGARNNQRRRHRLDRHRERRGDRAADVR